ncbi:MAG TPA: hypothetical protein VIV60_17565 [Polyangiaceae bacterium]
MQKALVTLSGAGLVACLVFSSCVVKESKDDDNDGGSDSGKGGGSSVATGGARATTTAGVPKGGTPAVTPGATGGAYVAPSTGVGGGEAAAECVGLLEQLKKSPEQVCSQSKVEAHYSKMNMLIVLDKSGSMTAIPSGYSKSKWAGAVDAIKASLNPNDPLVSYGIALYPYASPVPASTCELPSGQDAVNVRVGPAVQTVPLINDLMSNTTPGGGTPTAAALGAALDYYTKGAGIGLDGTKYVLLVTDGGPNCNKDINPPCGADTCTAFMDKSPALANCWDGSTPNCCDPSVQTGALDPRALCLDDVSVTTQLNALHAAGINTFVIGIPGSEAYAAYLDGFAVAGGEPVVGKARKYYEVTGESGLTEAFKTITTKLIKSCEVPLIEAPKDRSAINVAIDCAVLPQKTSDVVNWVYDDATQAIIIQGPKCEQIKASGVTRIDVVNGCPVYVIE